MTLKMLQAQKTVARDFSHESAFGDEASDGESVTEQDQMHAYLAPERQSRRAEPRESPASGSSREWADVEANVGSKQGDEDKFGKTWSSPVFSSPRSCSPWTAPEATGGGLEQLKKIDRIRDLLQIQLTAATIVAAANVTMGLAGTGSLPEQADALLAALGEL